MKGSNQVAQNNHGAVYAVLLAAGASRRFGDENKLLAEIEGIALVRRVAKEIVNSRAAGIIAVTGFESERIREALTGLEIKFAENPDFAEGLASSIKCGVAALPADATGAMIVLADMPGMAQAHLNRLISIFESVSHEKIVYSERKDGSQVSPVIWPARYFNALKKLEGDRGAKHLIRQNAQATRPVNVDNEKMLGDIDTPDDLETWILLRL